MTAPADLTCTKNMGSWGSSYDCGKPAQIEPDGMLKYDYGSKQIIPAPNPDSGLPRCGVHSTARKSPRLAERARATDQRWTAQREALQARSSRIFDALSRFEELAQTDTDREMVAFLRSVAR